MFNNKNRIKDYNYRDDNRQSLKPVAYSLAFTVAASALLSGSTLDDIKYSVKDLLSGNKENDKIKVFNYNSEDMFCPAPGASSEFAGDWLRQDPFERFLLDDRTYASFWIPSEVPKTLPLEFAMNATDTSDKSKFFETIPQSVIDNPEVHFILSGHASYDLDEKYGTSLSGAGYPKNFNDIAERHRTVNKRVVDKRLESVRGKLIESGIAEDRIHVHNFISRYDKRAVDVEVCFNGVPEDDATID